MAERVLQEGFTPRGLRGTRLVIGARALLVELWRRLAGGYRPERHYMRGPGPKWHERNSANRV
jgi:hypothetical protein